MRQITKMLLLSTAILALTSCGRDNIQGTGEAKVEVRNLAEFTGLNVNGNFEILGAPGSPDKFVISSNANILPYILTDVKDDVVMVNNKKSADLHPTVAQKIWITVPKFNSLTLNGSSIFQFQNLTTDDLTIKLSGSHQILLTGKADSINLTISGSSDIDARNFVTTDATVEINGSSTVYVNPTNSLKVTINGEGKVIYFSPSPKIEQAINGAGQVISNFGKIGKEVPRPDQTY